MSSGDFAEELRQSVQDQLSLIQAAARAAKARIGQGIVDAGSPQAPPAEVPPILESSDEFGGHMPAVDFFAEEPIHDEPMEPEDPAFAAAVQHSGNGVPDGAIEFDSFDSGGMDDEGIPVWEEPP